MVKARDQDIRFIKSLIQTLNATIHVAQLGRVYRTNEDNSLVDIQPLALNSSGTKRAPLINVPVGLVARQYIKEGAVVLVQFLDRSKENWDRSSNQEFPLGSKRMHDVNDAIVSEVMWIEGHSISR